MSTKVEFKPTASLIADAIWLLYESTVGKRGRGIYARKPFLRNITVNEPEAEMIKARAAAKGINTQKYIRELIHEDYLRGAELCDKDLYDYVAGNIDLTKIIQTLEQGIPSLLLAENLAETVTTKSFDSDLESAIDAMCFQAFDSDAEKIRKTMDALLTSMKKGDVLEAVGDRDE